MDTSKTLWRGSVFGILAAVFAVVAMILSPIAGLAVGTDDEVTADPSGVDLTAKGSITVHKHESPAWGDAPNDGTEITEPQSPALEGVKFTVKKVDIDLKVATNWEKISQLTYDSENNKAKVGDETYDLGDPASVDTNDDGVAVFGDLAVGVYLVEETDPGDNIIATKAEPFFVVVPLPHNNGWLYDVQVYPKNTVTTVDKTLDDSEAFTVGDPLYWNVTVTIPKGHATTLTSLVITDDFDIRVTDPRVVSVTLDGKDVDSSYYDVTIAGNKVTVTFNDDGLAALPKADKTGTLVVRYKALVGKDLVNGQIPNTANVVVNDSSTEVTTGTKSDWGRLNIFKYEGTDDNPETGTGLEGAVFKVFKKENATDEVAELTTDANGQANITLKAGTYWVKEITAPAGYKLKGDPQEVTVNTSEGGVWVKLANDKIDGPSLPVTGASGQLLMTVGGLAILLMASGALFVGVKRSRIEH